ncbi:glutamine--tRNA ligase/YqeY domain fusion protein [Anaerofustis stercorihominis]|uniref:glutamine--tRNA ligase/YqeY domain fusion protein n=1 Tax=Anaerofustis stercorihominis TaxID=214853 RepID=UPI00214C6C6C|nr:glutamine--tRNA ligase/YqeY domain fusion protein [Anaerofustis stercorihominis]MCR2033787.1 glutamine--tRNA ligase/YqeY domain fusion protein [Anaerofustis stercorihominis]
MGEIKSNFITNEIDKDIEKGIYDKDEIYTRFPPEPNGFLHIGHAKAICINFLTAKKYGGKTNLRFDDTNPAKEDTMYVKSIKEDISWLGFEWAKELHASNYFDKMYAYAVELISKGLAYVDDQSYEEMKKNRGNLATPGVNSPYRDRSVEENLNLFKEMKEGKYETGSKVLRAKIDMTSPNMNMRDPALYRVVHEEHHNTKDNWCIYPMYDFAHPIEDAIEGITHSLCSLEFEDHRPLYDWILDNLDDYKNKRPRQIEFARLNLTNQVMSKRYLRQLVDEGYVDGWDDPRMPTISGFRRRGVTPEAIVNFCEEIGVSKSNSLVDSGMLDHFIRDDLKLKADRVNAVLNPLKLTITNYPEGKLEMLEMENNQDIEDGEKREVPFGRELYVEKEDFMEVPVKKYFRLFPGNEVRLRGAYFVTCNEVVKDENGEVVELKCTYDPETKSGSGFTGRKVKGTIHWVERSTAIKAKARLLEPLFNSEVSSENFLDTLNTDSLNEKEIYLEPFMKKAKAGDRYQFVRNGYFSVDPKLTKYNELVFNRIVSLKSSWRPPKK